MEIDMKKLENKCMLITYSDSMGHNLADLNEILDKYFKKQWEGSISFRSSLLRETGDLHRWITTKSIRHLVTGTTWNIWQKSIT